MRRQAEAFPEACLGTLAPDGVVAKAPPSPGSAPGPTRFDFGDNDTNDDEYPTYSPTMMPVSSDMQELSSATSVESVVALEPFGLKLYALTVHDFPPSAMIARLATAFAIGTL